MNGKQGQETDECFLDSECSEHEFGNNYEKLQNNKFNNTKIKQIVDSVCELVRIVRKMSQCIQTDSLNLKQITKSHTVFL